MGHIIEKVLTITFFITFLTVMIYQFTVNSSFLDTKKGLSKCKNIPLPSPVEEFFERLEKQNSKSNNYFHCIIAGDSFILRYLPPGTVLFGWAYWKSLKGIIIDGNIYYEFTGLFSVPLKTYERERLLKNVIELAAKRKEVQV